MWPAGTILAAKLRGRSSRLVRQDHCSHEDKKLVWREPGLKEVSIQQDPEVLELCGGTLEFLLSERDAQRITE